MGKSKKYRNLVCKMFHPNRYDNGLIEISAHLTFDLSANMDKLRKRKVVEY